MHKPHRLYVCNEVEQFKLIIIQNNVKVTGGELAPVISETQFSNEAWEWYNTKYDRIMTPHDKVIYIIQQLELSDSKVARAIQKGVSTATHKRLRLRDNKFTEQDFQRIRDFYIEKLRKIEELI